MNKISMERQKKLMALKRKQRNIKFWISIVKMLIVLILITLTFTFLMNVVFSSPMEDDEQMKESSTVQKVESEKEVSEDTRTEEQVEEVKEENTNEPELMVVDAVEEKEDDFEFPYKEALSLPMEHQKFLYERCVELGLDFEKTLAVMEHESKFDPNAIGETHDYGYFQVNIINHEWLAEELNTENKPLDPYINIRWGTYMLADLYDHWKERGLSGQALDEAVWSSYNKGLTGFKKTGHATNYISKVKESLAMIQGL